ILRDLWPKTPRASAVRPLLDLRSITGLDFDNIELIAKAFAGKSMQDGYFRPWTDADLAHAGDRVKDLLSTSAQASFLEWASASYATIRREAKKHRPPADTYEQFRFNPLHSFPIVRPDVQPTPQTPPVYLVPCTRLLFERASIGVYHDL